ncbi:MAG: PQQ-binding-like beta-propeller repeat protein [Acidimicrobiia bacterium]|nr:PQQ-binding-like beta-propeller repeat protein [Acidimicrobiia bacterium]MYC57068.1 PQQ-binding-like beta-propeller repeat protein [Acidimicrobiia bacterium]MYI30145.1 PQQ-binding-like beta-propeller repeat protein [Acidimicrobiia bacterium]
MKVGNRKAWAAAALLMAVAAAALLLTQTLRSNVKDTVLVSSPEHPATLTAPDLPALSLQPTPMATPHLTPQPTPQIPTPRVIAQPTPTVVSAQPALEPINKTYAGWVDPASVGKPYGTMNGLLTFRGNPTRTFYGTGPAPLSPEVLWHFAGTPQLDLCSPTSWTQGVTLWCGTGWTGQPAIIDNWKGRTRVVVGTFAPGVHFLDATTGQQWLPEYVVGDLVKGSVTIDPDGFPLVYFGSRDNYFRILAFDRSEPTELWRLSAYDVAPTVWNNDWDGASLVLKDYLFQGGENSQFLIIKLNRSYDSDGLVVVDPELMFHSPGWDQELLNVLGDNNVSIEGGMTVIGNTLYFGNSGGLVQGWDISGLAEGRDPERVFRYWVGDDVDATVIADGEGYIYVGVEYERGTARSQQLGQMLKLNPASDDPLVWAVDLRSATSDGVWATAALTEQVVYVPTSAGYLYALSRATGEVLWRKRLGGPIWSSPVVIDEVLIQADCNGTLYGYDISEPQAEPPELWQVTLGGCIESTPAVWEGVIYVGDRQGGVYAVGDH